ncbi:hypothetical protein V6Z12_D08G056400 [Gossypium hirsutum]
MGASSTQKGFRSSTVYFHLPEGFHWFHRSSTVSLFFNLLKVQNSCFIYLRCFHYQCNGLNGLD